MTGGGKKRRKAKMNLIGEGVVRGRTIEGILDGLITISTRGGKVRGVITQLTEKFESTGSKETTKLSTNPNSTTAEIRTETGTGTTKGTTGTTETGTARETTIAGGPPLNSMRGER